MAVSVKSRHVVKPSEPTWNGILPLSELDQIGVITNTTIIFFYKKPTIRDWLNPSNNKIINTLRDSLSHALVSFYPLAGRLHSIEGGRLELECNAVGAELIEAEFSKPMSSLGDLSCCQTYQDLIPKVDYCTKSFNELPLFLVQLTRFKCGGLSVGMSISHTIIDGQSAFHFFREWARLARGEPLEALPYIDRRILQVRGDPKISKRACPYQHPLRKAPQFEDVDHFSRLPTVIGQPDNSEERKKMITATILLPLSKSQVHKLKKVANYRERSGNIMHSGYGRFEVVAAHIWRCACKARGHVTDQPTALCFCVDSRDRLDPPLPPRYFGNAIVDVVATSQAGELTLKPLSHACNIIRETIQKVTNEFVYSTIEFFKTQESLFRYQDRDDMGGTEGVFYGNPNLGIASWLNLPARDLDFGWGKEIFMGPGCFEFDGDVMILPGYEDDGSIVVALGLQASHMEKFKKYFYDDIDALEFEIQKPVMFISSRI